jgi:hypothetical protein
MNNPVCLGLAQGEVLNLHGLIKIGCLDQTNLEFASDAGFNSLSVQWRNKQQLSDRIGQKQARHRLTINPSGHTVPSSSESP